jgi:hypothetical protein
MRSRTLPVYSTLDPYLLWVKSKLKAFPAIARFLDAQVKNRP